MDVNRIGASLEHDGGSVPCAFTGRFEEFIRKNQQDIRSFASCDDFVYWARSVENSYVIPERIDILKCHEHILVPFIKRTWTKEKRTPEKKMLFPFGLVSEEVRLHAHGRRYFQWLHLHSADQFTFVAPTKNAKSYIDSSSGGCPERILRSYYTSAMRAISGLNPSTGTEEEYTYTFSKNLFEGGNLWTLSYFMEEKFVARWQPAVQSGHTTREEMFQRLGDLVRAKAEHDFYLDWRHYLVDDASYVLDGYREVFWAAAHAINGRNIIDGSTNAYIRREE